MFEGRRVAAIIAAGGKGTRMGSDLPKQYMKIGGQPVLIKAMKTFENMEAIDHIFVVAGEDYVQLCEDLIGAYGLDKVESVVAGGEERQDSVYNALQEMTAASPVWSMCSFMTRPGPSSAKRSWKASCGRRRERARRSPAWP